MIKCIIVDDEQPARELIALHLSELSDFELLGTFDNALTAFSFLQLNQVDLVFLDIQMPRMSGLELVKSLKKIPRIIFTTAFREFAVEAFELDVLDYLVKPITQERFLKAISKFNYQTDFSATPDTVQKANPYIFLKVGREQAKLFLDEILYIEGFRDYIKVHTESKVILAYERLSYMEAKLPESRFVRIHKSYVVPLEKIVKYTNEEVQVGRHALPIGRVYKNGFLEKFKPLSGGL